MFEDFKRAKESLLKRAVKKNFFVSLLEGSHAGTKKMTVEMTTSI
jgi:hypothetical protein